MAGALTDLGVLDQFTAAGVALPGAVPTYRALYSPVDQVHEALKLLISSAQRSLVVAMYGFDDQELADILKAKLQDPTITVQLTLDSSQASGIHEQTILSGEAYPASSISVGTSERGQIMHLKSGVVDAAVVFQGSTNWSNSGEALQDNDLIVQIDGFQAAALTTRISAIHTFQLQGATP